MAFYGWSYFTAQASQTPDVTAEDVQVIKDTMKFLRKDQLKFIYALMMFNAAKEGNYIIGGTVPYGGACLGPNISPSFVDDNISQQMYKIIKLFLQEISQ